MSPCPHLWKIILKPAPMKSNIATANLTAAERGRLRFEKKAEISKQLKNRQKVSLMPPAEKLKGFNKKIKPFNKK
jgi:hypothetical protein